MKTILTMENIVMPAFVPQINRDEVGLPELTVYVIAHPMILGDLQDWWKTVARDADVIPNKLKLARFSIVKSGVAVIRFHPVANTSSIVSIFQAKAMLADYFLRQKTGQYPAVANLTPWVRGLVLEYYFENRVEEKLGEDESLACNDIFLSAWRIILDEFDAEASDSDIFKLFSN